MNIDELFTNIDSNEDLVERIDEVIDKMENLLIKCRDKMEKAYPDAKNRPKKYQTEIDRVNNFLNSIKAGK